MMEKTDIREFGSRRLIEVVISAENTGCRRTAAVAQLYAGELVPRPENPVKELKRFYKFHLDPGEKQSVRLTLDDRDFAVFDTGCGGFITRSGNYRLYLGSNATDIADTADITL
jgi:beta-glucosidase